MSCQAAIPLIIEVLKCDPSAAKVRISPKEDLPDGKLGLHMALERRWPKQVVEALLEANPEAATTMDAVKVKCRCVFLSHIVLQCLIR